MSSAPADVPAATRVENAGLDVISESDRKGRPSDLFMPWFAANISVLGLSWGAWVLGFGLSFWQAVVAGSVGVIVSFLLCGVVAVLGKRGSAPTLALSRAAFGYNGNRLSAALSWILTVGWETVLCVSATLASATVFQALGWHNQVGAQILGFLLTVGLAASAGILGFEAIMRVQTWITWPPVSSPSSTSSSSLPRSASAHFWRCPPEVRRPSSGPWSWWPPASASAG